ncbi:hypothetical protein FACS1894125_4740 [Actinomycetota bacterium]|nr:hypothetical protein FACS1894125_4740 [Actinomycetota bacterium]
MDQNTHLDPVKVVIPFGKKVKYAKYQSHLKVKAIRERNNAKYAQGGNPLLINILQVVFLLVIIAAVTIAIVLSNSSGTTTTANNSTSQTNSSGKTPSSGGSSNNNNPTPDVGGTTSPSVDSGSGSDSGSSSAGSAQLADQVTDALLKSYNVAEFNEIPDEVLANISTISNSSPGKVSVRLRLTYSQTTRTNVREASQTILSKVQGDVPSLMSVVVVTNDNYYIEVANRSE